ncbi:MAG: retron St85 family RNA-directed DNA polymerase [Pseudidiomarina maritima]|nr:retron St85 family RNA-directed DNA polymerase [Pseudidiomarina maritima]
MQGKWIEFLEDRGVRADLIEKLKPTIEALTDKNLPIIFELEHLSKVLGIEQSVLSAMIASANKFYRVFSIPKRKGGRRTICSPYPSLLSVQQWIYSNILSKVEVHSAAHGFVCGRSIVTNASCHVNKSALLKMDLKDFFDSIPINWVVSLFSSLGYPKNVSYYLASLCCLENSLSQGAATSPSLSNILLYQLDERLMRLSKSHYLTYTRYADDMSFSGKYISQRFQDSVKTIVEEFGLTVNSKKTSLRVGKSKKAITGLNVTGERVLVSKKFKRRLRQEIYFIKKFGYLSHINKLKIRDPEYKASLLGKLAFIKQVEPDNDFADEAIATLKNLKT